MGTRLVICLGNVARRDDGIAHMVGHTLTALSPAETRVLISTGLDVAMLDDVADSSLVIIVDAQQRTAPLVAVEVVEAHPTSAPTGHGIDPQGLLALASSIYGQAPHAYLVTLAAPEMAHGEGFSPTAEQAADEALSVIARLVSG